MTERIEIGKEEILIFPEGTVTKRKRKISKEGENPEKLAIPLKQE